MIKDTIKAGGKKYHLHARTGRVVSNSKNISSSNFIHDQVFLVDKTGKEHSIQLTDFDVACREGNLLTVMWAIQKGKDSGDYVAVRNHTTEQTFFDDRILHGLCLRGFTIRTLLVSWVIFFLFFGRGWGSFFGAITFGSMLGFVISAIIRERQADKESNHLTVDLEKIITEIKV